MTVTEVRVIGLDVSTSSTGLAMPNGSCRTIKPKAGVADPTRRLSEILALSEPYLKLAHANVAVIEGYSLFGPQQRTLIRLAEVGGAVRARLFEHDVAVVEVEPKRLKKYATGNGNASKDDMVAAARGAGAVVANDDEADAWWLWALGRSQFSATWEPSFRTVELLEVRAEVRASVAWPVLEGAGL